MADRLVFALSLEDLVTKPAKMMEKSIEGLGSKLEILGKKSKAMAAEMQRSGSLLGTVFAGALKASGEAAELTGAAFSLVAPAVGYLGEAAAGAAFEFAKFSVEAVESREKMEALLGTYGKGPEAGKQALEMIDSLRDALPESRKDLAAWAVQFQQMGVRDVSALKSSLLAMGAASALAGKEGETALLTLERKIQVAEAGTGRLKIAQRGLGEQLNKTGVATVDVAAKMGLSEKVLIAQLQAGTVNAKKFGDALQQALLEKGQGPLEKFNHSIDALKNRFHDDLDKLFEGIDIEPFLDALGGLGDLFSDTTESGKTLKEGVVSIGNALFQLAAKSILAVKHGIQDLIITWLEADIWMLKHKETVNAVKDTLEVFAGVLSGVVLDAIAGLIPEVVTLGAAILATTWPLSLVTAAVFGVAEAFEHWGEIKKWFSPLLLLPSMAAEAVNSLIDGLTSGIKSGEKWVIDAMSGLGHKAIAALKSVLHIGSPSKIMFELGGFAGIGLARGLSAKRGAVGESSRALGKETISSLSIGFSERSFQRAPILPREGPSFAAPRFMAPGGSDSKPAPREGHGKGGAVINVMPGAITINGAANVNELTEEALSILLEKISLTQGV